MSITDCCTVSFHDHSADDSAKPKCKFGDNSYEVGEQVKVKQHEICLECSCLVPPEITCKHKACPSAPSTDEKSNCTTQYIEGECCPQYKCTSPELAGNYINNLEEKGKLVATKQSILYYTKLNINQKQSF